MKNGKIESFTDLKTWQEGHKLVVLIYSVTSNFPQKEIYSLTDQIRRAAASITANIAEGFGRQTYKEKVNFYYIAKGSLNELRNFLLIAKDVGYLNESVFKQLNEQTNISDKLLQGLIKKTKTFSITR